MKRRQPQQRPRGALQTAFFLLRTQLLPLSLKQLIRGFWIGLPDILGMRSRHNVHSNIHVRALYPPVFQPLVTAIASQLPLPLLVALWAVSHARTLERMTTAKAGLKLQWRAWRQKRQLKQRLPSQLQPA